MWKVNHLSESVLPLSILPYPSAVRVPNPFLLRIVMCILPQNKQKLSGYSIFLSFEIMTSLAVVSCKC